MAGDPIKVYPECTEDLCVWKGSTKTKLSGLEVWEGQHVIYIEGIKKDDSAANAGIRMPKDPDFLQQLAHALHEYAETL